MPKERRGKKKTSRGDSSAYSYATKDTAREVKEKSSVHLTTKSTRALQKRYFWWGVPVRARIVYKEDNSIVCEI